MDFSYLNPRHLQQLHDGLLLQAMVEFRQAARLLLCNPTQEGEELRDELTRVLQLLEEEFARRGHQIRQPKDLV